MENLKRKKLGKFLKPYRNEHIVQDDKDYRQVTISKNHGISFRGSKLGKNIGRKRQFIIDLQNHPNTVLFTRQGVLDGAIGIAPVEVDKCIVTENMPMMSVDTDVIEMAYLRKLLLSDYLYKEIRSLTVTGSAQKSIHERDLLNIEIQIPDIKTQQEVCKKFNILDAEHSQLKTELTHQQILLKKLRQQILQEAIEGKLTAEWRQQNPDVEPASELLTRIQAEKAQLIKDKKIKPQKPLPPISDEEKPFELPKGWIWCRIGDTNYSIVPNRDKPKSFTGKIPWVTIADINENSTVLSFSSGKGLSREEATESNARIMPTGSVLTGCVGRYGIAAIIEQPIIANQQLHCFVPLGDMNQVYIAYSLMANRKYFESVAIQTTLKYVNKTKMESMIFSLPPLPEQKAIVAKVEKLLALCDQLEAQITSNQSHAEQLMQAVLKEAFSQPEVA